MSSKRLDPLIRRASSHEDALAKDLALKLQTHQQHERRRDDLERFRSEYETPPPGSAVSPNQLVNRAAFLAKIDDAVSTQRKHLATSEEALAIERTRLLLASRDKLVLEKLAASYRSVEQKAQERRDQSTLDDLGARTHAKHRQEDRR